MKDCFISRSQMLEAAARLGEWTDWDRDRMIDDSARASERMAYFRGKVREEFGKPTLSHYLDRYGDEAEAHHEMAACVIAFDALMAATGSRW
jgi:hypothetical protein